MPIGRYPTPSLTPAYGLGSYNRTGPAVLISAPRTKIGSQGRCYAFAKSKGKGEAYIQMLLNSIGPQKPIRFAF